MDEDPVNRSRFYECSPIQEMKIQFNIPQILGKYSEGKTQLEYKATTVARLLNQVQGDYPDLFKCLCDETGRLRKHINLFLNGELLAERIGFKQRLKANDVVSVFQAVSGG